MSLMTGLYPEAHRVKNFEEGGGRLPESVATLAGLLTHAGYRSIAVTSGGNVRGSLGFERGFERYEEHLLSLQGFPAAVGALDELGSAFAAGGSPFFLFLHTYQVHDPYLPPPSHAGRFADPSYRGRVAATDAELREEWQKRRAAEPKLRPYLNERPRLFWSRVDKQSQADRQRLVDLYDAGIAYTDEWLGSLLARLDALGIAEQTLVIVLSDHGEAFLEHGRFKHADVYDEVLRIPLVIRPPRSTMSRRVTQPVQMVDVLPTVLDAVGVAIPAHVQGRSLNPTLLGEPRAEGPVFAQWRARSFVSLRRDGFKYIGRPGHAELYDVAADPGERHNLAEQKPVRLRELAAEAKATTEQSRRLQPDAASPGEKLDGDTRSQLEALGYLE
jgi:arylsulfatase A-like enzyme